MTLAGVCTINHWSVLKLGVRLDYEIQGALTSTVFRFFFFYRLMFVNRS